MWRTFRPRNVFLLRNRQQVRNAANMEAHTHVPGHVAHNGTRGPAKRYLINFFSAHEKKSEKEQEVPRQTAIDVRNPDIYTRTGRTSSAHRVAGRAGEGIHHDNPRNPNTESLVLSSDLPGTGIAVGADFTTVTIPRIPPGLISGVRVPLAVELWLHIFHSPSQLRRVS